MTALRRARPALGTLVELGIGSDEDPRAAAAALEAGWRAIRAVEEAASAFLPESDLGRLHAAPAGARVELRTDTAAVLGAADELRVRTCGLFDVTRGTGPWDWWLTADGRAVRRRTGHVRLDLGGIAKGHAVDRGVEAMAAELEVRGAPVACWVNAGGDLRVCGLDLPVRLRDEQGGGARPWLVLREGAVATSHFAAGAERLTGGPARALHVSVAAPRCLWSDALTKIVGLTGDADHPAVRERGATAWIHG
jgi:thiamine biosynthesis lipoprotein